MEYTKQKGAEAAPRWRIRNTLFQVKPMLDRLRKLARDEQLPQFAAALDYASAKHAGAVRKPNRFATDAEPVPYIAHPLMMACEAHALGIRDEEVLAAIMLHDVCEDCHVTQEELPFSPAVQAIVALLTKDESRKHQPGYTRQYYDALQQNPGAAIVKALDRCSNVSTMAGSFTREKLHEYIIETETYVYPLLTYITDHYPQYGGAAFVLQYQIMSLLETIKSMEVADGATLWSVEE